MKTENDKPPRAQRWALWAALAAYLTFLLIYLLSKDIPYIQLRADSAAWGQFGDYVGGVINPVVGLITIWLLTASLKQSQQEMALTRKALQDAEASQKATEAALRDQIEVSEQARDMANAIALYNRQAKVYEELGREYDLDYNSPRGEYLHSEIAICNLALDELGRILKQEHLRLVSKYPPNPKP